MRTHTKEKKEKCKYCKVSFTDPSGLRQHIKRFHKETIVWNPYLCRLCKKSFTKKKELEKHIMTHLRKKQIFSLNKVSSEIN